MHPLLFIFAAGYVGGQLTVLPLTSFVRVSLLDLSVIMLLVYGALREKKRIIPALWVSVLGFVGVSMLSVVLRWTTAPLYLTGGGLLYVLRWMVYAGLYWVARGRTFPSRNWGAVLIISGLGLGVAGLVQMAVYPDLRNLWYLGWDPHYQRLFGSLLDPNFTGIILVMTFLSLLGLPFGKGYRTHVIVGLLISLSALILTYSRSGMLSFVTGVTVWGLLAKKKMMVLVLIAFLAVGIGIVPKTGEGRNLLRSASSLARVDNAASALRRIAEKPVFGHGMQSLMLANVSGNSARGGTVPSRTGAGYDSSLLFVAASSGLVGLGVYLWMLASFFRLGYRGLSAGGPARRYAAVYLSGLCSLLVHSLFVHSLFYPWVLVWVWVSTGALERSLTADT